MGDPVCEKFALFTHPDEDEEEVEPAEGRTRTVALGMTSPMTSRVVSRDSASNCRLGKATVRLKLPRMVQL